MLFSLRHVLIALVAVTVSAAADNVDGYADRGIQRESATRYIRDFNVSYGDDIRDMPKDAVQVQVDLADVSGSRDNDINAGRPGPYVWLTRVYTADAEAAATSFELVHTSDPVPGLSDLSAGGAGRYRYLVPTADPAVRRKITKAALFRSKHALHEPPYGDMLGPALTEGPGRDYLYLLFATVEVPDAS